MVTCPWCGTSYADFQSNCKNCGAPLSPGMVQTLAANPASAWEPLPEPPPPPRPISAAYAWRLIWTDGWGLASIILAMIGTIFTFTGAFLSLFGSIGMMEENGSVMGTIGLLFLAIGLLLVGIGLAGFVWRFREAWWTVQVLKLGQATRGQITGVEANYNVRISGRHPWEIAYVFEHSGRLYDGKVSSLNRPGPHFQAEQETWVMFLPESPRRNALYPHP